MSVDSVKNFTIHNGIINGGEFNFLENGKNNFGQVLLELMKKNSKSIGQMDATTGKEDTYESMVDRSVRCALWLRNQNINPGDVIAICTHNHLDQVIPALAALYTGVIFNPWWDYGLTDDVAKHFIELTKPKVLFVNEACAKTAARAAKEANMNMKIVIFGSISGFESFEKIISKQGPIEVQNFRCSPLKSVEHPALILYTSGTTGLPKGALHSHRSLFGNIKLISEVNGNNKVGLWYATLCWVSGILCTFSTIWNGVERVIPGPFIEDDTCKIIEKYKIQWVMMSTSMANRILKSGVHVNYNLTSVMEIVIGGAPLKEETQAGLREAFPKSTVLQAYGTTELGGLAVKQEKKYKINSVGVLAKGFQAKIIDPENNRILGPNEQGEACFKSAFMMTGYYRNPDSTKDVIDTDGWFHTGDLTYYDEDGAIFIIDRLKELIKWQGHHVAPATIEKLIQTLPGVAEVAVVPVSDWEDSERPLAFVVKAPNSDVTEEQIIKLVDDNLSDQMRLRAGVKFMDQIPHTASGKIGRRELKSMAEGFARK